MYDFCKILDCLSSEELSLCVKSNIIHTLEFLCSDVKYFQQASSYSVFVIVVPINNSNNPPVVPSSVVTSTWAKIR